jgi:regulatory protein
MTRGENPGERTEALMPVWDRISRFCAYQERCTADIKKKLAEWSLTDSKAETVIERLAREGFLDDRRFARAFVRGKFRLNQWGRKKIVYELRTRQIAEDVIYEAFSEISEDEYSQMIRLLISKKRSQIKKGKAMNLREKIITFVVGKGFEYGKVVQVLEEDTL